MSRSDKRTKVGAYRHEDKRSNIPTEELRDFVADDEARPVVRLYPRDPSLDPQLVWRGKDEQDRQPLEVPVVPVYIQEKIQPQAIVEEVRRHASATTPSEVQLGLFDDFNGIPFEELVDFYRHEQNWTNRLILGDSLYVMTSLAEKEGLKGKVQMIYIDPPYGIKFGSNWQVSTRKRDVKDGKVEDMAREPEVVKAFRDTWELGIHSYLTYLRDRLTVARELLTETGSIFVQISDDNVHMVRCIMDEVFGSENFVGMISFFKTSSQSTIGIQSIVDYVIVYSRNPDAHRIQPLLRLKSPGERGARQYVHIVSPDMQVIRRMSDDEISGFVPIPEGWKICRLGPTTSQGFSKDRSGPYVFRDEKYRPSAERHWSYDPSPGREMDKLASLDRVRRSGKGLATVLLADDNPTTEYDNVWLDTGTGSFTEPQVFVVQTANKVIERCLLMATAPGDLVLDPTCGSGTTAYVAEQWGRRWITIDTSRVALALARTRLMAARYPYYILADSPEGIRKEAEVAGQVPLTPLPRTESDVRKGFVYRRVPHITLKSIANNEEIDVIHARYQEQLEPLRARLNAACGADWEEWELPREANGDWSDDARDAHTEWWRFRRERQAEIDASIARRADTELLVDQPYEDAKRIRVAGPFTVESLAPHRVLHDEAERPDSERVTATSVAAVSFEEVIIDNLRKAGVQNTRRSERLRFDSLDPFAGTWIQAAGTYTAAEGNSRSVAVSIGGEHTTVGATHIKEAAKEALKGAGFDLLVVCAMAFDAHAGETAKEFEPLAAAQTGVAPDKKAAEATAAYRIGRLPVMLARMNPDLAMGDDLLKKTGAGNLFMVFGEPDIRIETQSDGRLVVEILGVDVYDPTTGQVRSSSTDDIACWFIDTDYNEESFFVRHAYFTGAEEPYDRLRRALRAEIDEAAWSVLYSTRSFPFERPATGRIAVKVINHYGDEVLKVYEV